jgi:hypothetical protein
MATATLISDDVTPGALPDGEAQLCALVPDPPPGVVEPLLVDALLVDPPPDDDFELLEQATPTMVSKAVRIRKIVLLLLLR